MEPATGIAALVGNVTALVSGAVDWVGDYIGTITATGNEVLVLWVVAVPLVGLGVGLIRRLLRVN